MINVRIHKPEVKTLSPKICVVGVGGAGGNAVNNMISSSLEGCEFVVCNTDAQALEGSLSSKKIQLGAHVTGGLGAGANPEVGRQAAEESLEEVMSYLQGANMAFITAGMGGGTGTGAAPVIARAAREAGVLTVGVVTKPFHFEGTHRMKMAEAGIAEMQDYVDTLIVIPNQNLFRIANEKTTFADAFKMADGVLQSGVRGVTDLMVMPGLINLDFADIRSAMREMGKAMMGNGEAEGDRRAIEAAEAAINNPLLDDVSMKGARGVIINVTGGSDMTLFEVDEACNRIRDEVDPNANIIFGSTFDEKLAGKMRVSVVATGIDVAEAKNSKTTYGGVRVTAVGQKTNVPEKPAVSRATPNATSTYVASASLRQAVRPAASPSEAAQRVSSAVSRAAAAAAKLEEPESDMFEQQDLVLSKPLQPSGVQEQAFPLGYAALRGSIQQGHFIPPAPVIPERQVTPPPLGYVPGYTVPAAMVQPMSQPSGSGLVLRPPVPGQGSQERKQTPTLFERITGVRKDPHASQKKEAQDAQPPQQHAHPQQQVQSGSFFSSSLRATPAQAERPAQGSLNIDAPSAPRHNAEDELDIPAFLRRQAN